MIRLQFYLCMALNFVIPGCATNIEGVVRADAEESPQNTPAISDTCGNGKVDKDEGEACDGDGTFECKTSCGSIGSAECSESKCELLTCTLPAETCNGIDDDCDGLIDMPGCIQKIYRYYNPSNNDHRYGTSTSPPAGYDRDPHTFLVYTEEIPGTQALYQKVKGKDYRLTLIKGAEPDKPDFTMESTLGFVGKKGDPKWNVGGRQSIEICQFYHKGINDHIVEVLGAKGVLEGYGYKLEQCFMNAWAK